MRTIAIINQKGGCGKTTCSINLAATFAGKGFRTLLVDMDPQSHCALGLNVPEPQIERSTADLLRAGLDGSICVEELTWNIARNLDLAPSCMALAGIEASLATQPDRDRRLAQVLAPVQDRYDYCLIDCPPSIGLLTFNALRCADEVIVPVETGYFSLRGAIKQEQTIQMLARRVHHNVRMSVLPTMYDVRTKLAREILSELKEHFGERVLPLVINFNAKLKEAASFGQPITEYDPASRGMQDFEELSRWLIANPPEAVFEGGAVAAVGGVGGVRNGEGRMAHLMEQPGGGTMETLAASAPASQGAAGAGRPGGLSRAAELVARARELSAKSAAISQRLARDPDNRVEQVVKEQVAPPAENQAPLTITRSDADAAASPAVDPAIKQRLARLYGCRPTASGLLFLQPMSPPEAPDAPDAPEAGDTSTRPPRTLQIAGDFNGWDPAKTTLQPDRRLGVWQACVPVPPGRYRYKLIVDGEWRADPYNPATEANPFGELNNVVETREPLAAKSA